jgi:ABC transport system ATP-binding/permease protein
VFKLTIEDDEGKTTVIPVIRDEMTIGRQDGNTIRLTERNVSRKHARLLRQNGTLYVEDLASYTGVRVNGARIVAVTPVAEGDEVQIGDYKLLLRLDRPAPAVGIDHPTMPSMPAALTPMGTVGGSVAIPTRGTPAMAPPIPQAAAAAPAVPAAPAAAAPPPPGAPAPRKSSPVPRSVSAVPDPMEAQPTIPVRTLSEDAFTGAHAEGSTTARLVVLTSEIAGTEFSLNRASVVLGRTEENDIVVNHRSISRHHAKIVREGDRYTIVDLQSANGVRVNNEDYERIELHAGDVIELGHVKLRFVGPFEHYVFDPNVRHDRPRFPTKLVLGLGAVAVAAVAAVALRGSRSLEGPGTGAPPSAAATNGMLAGTPGVPPGPGQSPQELLAEATRAAASEDWATARAALDKLGTPTGDAPFERQALELRRRVDTERQAAALFAQFGEAASAKNYVDALARYGEIPADSIYKLRARPRYDEARSLLVGDLLADAETARAAGRCADVRVAAEEIGRLEPQNQLPKQLVRLCHAKPEPALAAPKPPRPHAAAAPAASPTARPDRPEHQEKADRAEAAPAVAKRAEAAPAATKRAEASPAAAKRAEATPAEAEVDSDALMKQAREAWLKQQCGSAIDLSRKALKAKPGMTDAYQIIAVCSCSLKDAEGATRAYAKLDDKSRNLVRSLCQKNGIIVGGE